MPAEGQFVTLHTCPPRPSHRHQPFQTPLRRTAARTRTGRSPSATLSTMRCAGKGEISARITPGETISRGMDELKQQLDEIFSDPTLPFDQTMIKASDPGRYAALMPVIEAFGLQRCEEGADASPNSPREQAASVERRVESSLPFVILLKFRPAVKPPSPSEDRNCRGSSCSWSS